MLRLWTVIRIIILTRKNHQAHVFLEFTQLHSIKGEVVPTLNRRLEIVIKQGLTVSVVRPGPGEKNAFLIWPSVNVVGLVAVLDFVGHPNPLRGKALGG